MKLLDILLPKSRNPLFIKLKKRLPKQSIKNIKSAFYLGGFPYTQQSYEYTLSAIEKNELNLLLQETKYDVNEDNIELYLIQNEPVDSYIIILYDPYELYQPEEVLDIIPVNRFSLAGIKTEQIYP